MHTVYLSLGSNLGNREENLHKAITEIGKLVGEVVRQSTFYVTEPWGFKSDNLFANAAVCCVTERSPREVLALTQEIERRMGRSKKSSGGNYSDRIIDIDILYYDDITIDDADLKIPHPHIKEREFVMKPLEEIFR
ncbi:MAG: 2-amino-4-hydroxy-6-hydroxymethyldihydropteridine diphosphokinase [Prevotella sp.]|uniref:2-amino-4-hydroxy-6- hydroxymethyldihydropteridine diphosphokinase n=1 Tax=Prevotella sp. TaxID=59823 RepID=UPI002A29915F|nr:2-amino-4-hydroxy-6-hydroxymethyldihydropteridine diphosphokinase [Prevotella sp.]MDD7317389.1 2-amino-4-hydroxy-6-hydroxymethyldihydropteridine diphosphokinase [Prevotellaceae bacterium]MDY4019487.1 2-amino-4-hydroxy-6-hydroxymethyldihydropteridine diphosphokinase [Prevotella sp.]